MNCSSCCERAAAGMIKHRSPYGGRQVAVIKRFQRLRLNCDGARKRTNHSRGGLNYVWLANSQVTTRTSEPTAARGFADCVKPSLRCHLTTLLSGSATATTAFSWLLLEPSAVLAVGQPAESPLTPLTSGADSVPDLLYNLAQQMDALVQQQLTGVTPATYVVVLVAGLLTSLSPCTLSVLPLTIGYIGGYGQQGGTDGPPLITRSAVFALGLATTLAALGVVSAAVGRTYGAIGPGLPIEAQFWPCTLAWQQSVSLVAIIMGLNLLEVLPLQLPSLDVDVRGLGVPPLLQAYLAGLTFALAASPCSTPVLATLLGYVSTQQDLVYLAGVGWLGGASLLLAYTTGYVAPVLVAAAFTGAATKLLALRRWSAWVTPASGVLLLAGGTYTVLSRVLPG